MALGLGGMNANAQGNKITFERINLTKENVGEGVTVADFDKDGHVDVAAGPYLWKGPGFTQKIKYSSAGRHYMNIRAVDVNNDGWLDIPYQEALKDGFWLENPGAGKQDGIWQKRTFPTMGGETAQFWPLFTDKADVLLCLYMPNGTSGPLSWSRYEESQKKWVYRIISSKQYPRNSHGLGMGDINGDGRNDILAPDGWYEQPASLTGDPLWKFHPFGQNFNPYSRDPEIQGAHMHVDDLTGNGKADFVASLNGHGWGLSWFEQIETAGKISFKQHMIMGNRAEAGKYGMAFSQAHSLEFADINGDGLKDIVSGKRYLAHVNGSDPEGGADSEAVLYWFEQKRTASGTVFIPHLISNDAGSGCSLELVDLDKDGNLDIIVSSKKGANIFLTRGVAPRVGILPAKRNRLASQGWNSHVNNHLLGQGDGTNYLNVLGARKNGSERPYTLFIIQPSQAKN